MKVLRLSVLRTGRLYPPPSPQENSVVLIPVRVYPRATVRLEGLIQRKISIIPLGIKPATFRLVAQCHAVELPFGNTKHGFCDKVFKGWTLAACFVLNAWGYVMRLERAIKKKLRISVMTFSAQYRRMKIYSCFSQRLAEHSRWMWPLPTSRGADRTSVHPHFGAAHLPSLGRYVFRCNFTFRIAVTFRTRRHWQRGESLCIFTTWSFYV